MMDFGFCPALLESDFSYLFPPELDYISQKNTSFQNLEVYTSKLDSWLLGAFLYHLVKLNPISKAERNSTHILAHTERYQGLGICEFL
jgi:serine/threonine protein kinase